MQKSVTGSKRNYIRVTMAVLIVLFLLAGFLDFPPIWNKATDKINASVALNIPHYLDVPFRLGLDLRGGTHLVYLADMSQIPEDDRDEALEGVRDVIERRVNAFGVAEPLVQTSRVGDTYRVVVELAGISDINEAIKMIGETPILEFKEENDIPPRDLTTEEEQQIIDYNQAAKLKADEALEKVMADQDNFSTYVREYSEHESSKAKDGDLGFIFVDGEFSQLYEAIDQFDVGTLVDIAINTSDYYWVAKVEEKGEGEDQIKASHLLICFEGSAYCESGLSKEDALAKAEEIFEQATPENFASLVAEHSTEPGAAETGGDLGWFTWGEMVPAFETVAFNIPKGKISTPVETEFGYHLIYKEDERKLETIRPRVIGVKKLQESDIVPPVGDWKNTGLSGKHLDRAAVQFDQNTNEPMVSLEFNSEGKDLFAEITGRNVGKPVGIFLDGQPISVPTVNEAITAGRAVITGGFSVQEAKLLAQRLNAGALPVPIELISEQTVGPALGAISLEKSLFAGLIGFALVVLFMILYYRLPGLISVIALCFYTVFILALFKLIPVTLTLSGLAGFILSLGMAVDANVLIFERLKEEIRSGRTLSSAIDEGFRRAWTSIRDGNLTTLIACLILFWFSSSVIKGFALTLGIGVIISMISAVSITRVFLKLVAAWKPVKTNYWLFGAKPEEE